jgi:threonine 3-dehydrogenase
MLSLRTTFSALRPTLSVSLSLSRSFSSVSSPRILMTGSNGQIGTELSALLRKRYGVNNVVTTDLKAPTTTLVNGPFEELDIMNNEKLSEVIKKYNINKVIHLASLLSAIGERQPLQAMKVNSRGIENVLEMARIHNLQVFAPSTIAVFGPSTPRDATPDLTIMRPNTIYGVTKVYLELLGEYYHKKFGVDFRSMRFPGIISNVGPPGGGTTDYAVEIYQLSY